MARREQPATTTAAPTSRVAESDVRLSSSTQSERKDTNGQQDTIATRAYALYEERGYRQGCDLQDWFDAERELLSQEPPL